MSPASVASGHSPDEINLPNGNINGHNHIPGQGGYESDPIAIIGMACRFPQDATNTELLWDMLMKGTSAMTEVPEDRWNIDSHYHPDPSRGSAVRFISMSPLQHTRVNIDFQI
jgi:acyl transferase domain-containing protein